MPIVSPRRYESEPSNFELIKNSKPGWYEFTSHSFSTRQIKWDVPDFQHSFQKNVLGLGVSTISWSINTYIS